MGVEAVKEPFGPTVGAPVPLAVRQQRKSITWVTGESDNFMGFPLKPTIIYTPHFKSLGSLRNVLVFGLDMF